MPCNSDYMEPNRRELELSQVAAFLDELDGKPLDTNHLQGYHPKVYCKTVDGDKLVNSLCSKLQKLDVTKYSLELQIWWRDHQRADKERLEREMEVIKTEVFKKIALAKLTDYERKLLGL